MLQESFSIIRGRAGFWRIARTHDGVWWFISPQNQGEFLNGVTTVQPTLHGRDPRGLNYLSRDWDGRQDDASLRSWAEHTLVRVRSAGFKSLGAWCSPALHRCDVPMTRDLNVSRWAPSGVGLFSPAWAHGAEATIRQQALSLRDNVNLVGYYIDNELCWETWAIGPRACFDQLPADDANRLEVLAVIRQTWPTIEAFNRDWTTHIADWSQLSTAPALPGGAPAAYEQLEDRWLFHFARAYFQKTTDLIHKHDPNHLVLGCRFRGWAPPQVVRAARGLTDAQSLNYYAADALLDAQTFRMIAEESDQPLVISEYSFHALDGRSGDRNLSHFPAQVRDQAARAAGYRLMTQRLARVPYVIGADWFQWMDEPPSGRQLDGEDANMGVVDIHDRAYDQLVKAVRDTAPVLDALHAGSAIAANHTVWRDAQAQSHARNDLAGGADLLAQ